MLTEAYCYGSNRLETAGHACYKREALKLKHHYFCPQIGCLTPVRAVSGPLSHFYRCLPGAMHVKGCTNAPLTAVKGQGIPLRKNEETSKTSISEKNIERPTPTLLSLEPEPEFEQLWFGNVESQALEDLIKDATEAHIPGTLEEIVSLYLEQDYKWREAQELQVGQEMGNYVDRFQWVSRCATPWLAAEWQNKIICMKGTVSKGRGQGIYFFNSTKRTWKDKSIENKPLSLLLHPNHRAGFEEKLYLDDLLEQAAVTEDLEVSLFWTGEPPAFEGHFHRLSLPDAQPARHYALRLLEPKDS